MNRKKIVLIMLVVLAVSMILSCKANVDPLVGKWSNGLATVEFKAGGDFIIYTPSEPLKGTWKTSGGKLTTTLKGQEPETVDYRIEGDVLYAGSGPFNVYHRM